MSQENVEVVKAAFEAYNADDMNALRDLYQPDAIVWAPEGWPEPGPFVGRDAIVREFEQVGEPYDTIALEPISDFNQVADRVVVRSIWHGEGHGPDTNVEMTLVYTVRKGLVLALEYFWDYDEALKAVGLRESN